MLSYLSYELFPLSPLQVAVFHPKRGHRLRGVPEGKKGRVEEGVPDARGGAQPAVQLPPGAGGRLADLRAAGSL